MKSDFFSNPTLDLVIDFFLAEMTDANPTDGGAGGAAAAAGGEDKKDDHINLRVVSQDSNEVFFKIKRTTPLRKLMDAYCARNSLANDAGAFWPARAL